MHAEQCLNLNGALHKHYSTTCGINCDSVVNKSKYFHVTEGLVPDVMHDVLAGALELEMNKATPESLHQQKAHQSYNTLMML